MKEILMSDNCYAVGYKDTEEQVLINILFDKKDDAKFLEYKLNHERSIELYKTFKVKITIKSSNID